MDCSKMSRREFQRLTAAAFGGLVAGSALAGSALADDAPPSILNDPHVCRGLNQCKEKGGGDNKGKNSCAGQGSCATADKHDCKGQNSCKGDGGCGENPGENACKGKGSCEVPLKGDMWKTARKNFEKAMKKADKTFGDAPEK